MVVLGGGAVSYERGTPVESAPPVRPSPSLKRFDSSTFLERTGAARDVGGGPASWHEGRMEPREVDMIRLYLVSIFTDASRGGGRNGSSRVLGLYRAEQAGPR